MLVSPSLLAADFANLEREVSRITSADMLHLDVMDGCFVPNISFGVPVIEALRKKTALFFDVHLMLVRPLDYIDAFRRAGADCITFHIECADDPAVLINAIKDCGAKAGIAIKPGTPVETLYPYLSQLYSVTVMTVEPGFGGQKLMEAPLGKIKAMKERAPGLLAEIDGGVNEETVGLCRAAGADILVAGTAVFGAENAAERISYFQK